MISRMQALCHEITGSLSESEVKSEANFGKFSDAKFQNSAKGVSIMHNGLSCLLGCLHPASGCWFQSPHSALPIQFHASASGRQPMMVQIFGLLTHEVLGRSTWGS